jgi:hypothetical protein
MVGTWKAWACVAVVLVGCGGSDDGGEAPATGGAPSTGGLTAASGGAQETGGAPAASGGAGGAQSASGGVAAATGGVATGGVSVATGGISATGGALPTGGLSGSGGASSTGGLGQTGGAGSGGPASLWSATDSTPKVFFTTYPWNGPTPLMRATFSLDLDSCHVRFQSAWHSPAWTGSEDLVVSVADAGCLQDKTNCANGVKLTFSGCDAADCKSQRSGGTATIFRPSCSSQDLGKASSVSVLRRTVTSAAVTPSASYETLASTEKWELLGTPASP